MTSRAGVSVAQLHEQADAAQPLQCTKGEPSPILGWIGEGDRWWDLSMLVLPAKYDGSSRILPVLARVAIARRSYGGTYV